MWVAIVSLTALAQNNKEVEAINKGIQPACFDGTQNIGDMDKIDAGSHPDL